ncbi:MAG: hypothetical protein JST86_13185 [Bacteroidetes bacterium]|nr:hypothetical protein [Bacteroidota bacterium]
MPAFNLRNEILKEHSKAQCIRIVDWVNASQEKFDALFHLFLTDEYRVVQRAAWPISYCVQAHPQFIHKHWNALLKNLQQPNLHNAVKRNSIRLMQDIYIPKKYQGTVMDICFRFLESPNEMVAIKAFSLTVLGNLAAQYPDIIPEVKLLIEDQLPNQTAAFKVRAKAFLKRFK